MRYFSVLSLERWLDGVRATLARLCHVRVLWSVCLVMAIALSGCVKSDVVIDVRGANGGAIVQHIELSERLQRFSGEQLQHWIRTVEQRATAVGGQVQVSAKQALTVTIPFANTSELERKFNQFFEVLFHPDPTVSGSGLPVIDAALTVDHSNFLLWERDHFTYTVDLRSLGVSSASGDVLLSPASLLQLQFQLNTPWGARTLVRTGHLRSRSLRGGKTLIWSLLPGEQNTLETVFWLPNPIGIGAIVILILVGFGQFLKHPPLDRQPSQSPMRNPDS